MIDDNAITISIAPITGNFYRSIGSGIDRGSGRSTKIKTGMKLYGFINRVNTVSET